MESQGLKLEELDIGKMYTCRLSKKEMIVVKSNKPVKDEEGNDLMEVVTAGKYVTMNGDNPVFMYDELYDGQMKELTK